MKKLTVKQWIAIGIMVAAVIAEVVLVFTNPGTAVWAGVSYVLGGITGYWLKKKNIVNDDEKAEQ
jgi:EamA domain-containing membrane protein RarD